MERWRGKIRARERVRIRRDENVVSPRFLVVQCGDECRGLTGCYFKSFGDTDGAYLIGRFRKTPFAPNRGAWVNHWVKWFCREIGTYSFPI